MVENLVGAHLDFSFRFTIPVPQCIWCTYDFGRGWLISQRSLDSTKVQENFYASSFFGILFAFENSEWLRNKDFSKCSSPLCSSHALGFAGWQVKWKRTTVQLRTPWRGWQLKGWKQTKEEEQGTMRGSTSQGWQAMHQEGWSWWVCSHEVKDRQRDSLQSTQNHSPLMDTRCTMPRFFLAIIF